MSIQSSHLHMGKTVTHTKVSFHLSAMLLQIKTFSFWHQHNQWGWILLSSFKKSLYQLSKLHFLFQQSQLCLLGTPLLKELSSFALYFLAFLFSLNFQFLFNLNAFLLLRQEIKMKFPLGNIPNYSLMVGIIFTKHKAKANVYAFTVLCSD